MVVVGFSFISITETPGVASDGRVSRVDEEAATPFACVTFYKPLSHDELGHELTYEAFLEWVHELLPSPNIFYAIRIDGLFAYLKARSMPHATARPWVSGKREDLTRRAV